MNSKGCIEKSDVYRFFNRGVGLFAAPGATKIQLKNQIVQIHLKKPLLFLRMLVKSASVSKFIEFL